jgi:hypothetical protein
LRVYGLEGAIPFNRAERVNKAFELIRGNEIRKAEGDDRVLPDFMIDSLNNLAENSVTLYNTARNQLAVSKSNTEELRKLFNDDSHKLNALYSWVIAIWGNKTFVLFGIVLKILMNLLVKCDFTIHQILFQLFCLS